jgi:uncharacterized protein
VNPATATIFTVYVRVPNRQTSDLYTPVPAVSGLVSLAVNGRPVTPSIVKGYAVIRRTWKKGDRIDLELPMTIQKVTADSKITADSGRVALRYGPLMYNVETADQPDIAQRIGSGPLTLQWAANFLDGVMTINGSWADGSHLLAIPNYTRMNRVSPTPTPQSTRLKQPTRPNEPPKYLDKTPVSIVWIKE